MKPLVLLVVTITESLLCCQPPVIGVDSALVGCWRVTRLVTMFDAPPKKIETNTQEVKLLVGLERMDFRDDGTVEVKAEIPDRRTRRIEYTSVQLTWSAKIHRDGTQLLYLHSGGHTFLVGRYIFKGKDLWLTFSLESDKMKKETPRTFDPYQEHNAIILILSRIAKPLD